MAVPKYIKLNMQGASSTIVPPLEGGQVKQVVYLSNSQHGVKPLAIRLKVDYDGANGHFTDIATIHNLPAGL